MRTNKTILSEDEICYVKEHIGSEKYCDIASHLGYTSQQIANECRKLKIHKPVRRLSDEDVQVIIENYTNTNTVELADQLDTSFDAVARTASLYGVKKSSWYTDEQKSFIIDNYNKLSAKEIAKVIGTDTRRIQQAINKLCKPRINEKILTDDEIQFIKDNYAIMPATEIGKILGYNKNFIIYKANKLGLRKKRKINSSYFKDIDTPEKAYFLGFIFADGWICHNSTYGTYEFGMQLQSGDNYIIDRLDEVLGGGNYRSHIDPEDTLICGKMCHSNGIDGIRVFSKEIVEDLMSHGIEFNKSQKDTYPIVDDSLFFDFLRGYIDGDGCYYIDNGQTYMHITCASKIPLLYLQEKLKSFDIETRIYSENKKKHRLMCINGKAMHKLINSLYKDKDCICLTRKYERIKHFLSLAA